jgi:folate-binding protein YgfZ
MARTPLYEKLLAAGARMGDYAGVETALAFTDPRSEYAALRTGCAVYDLGWRGKIHVSGKDRTRWLNGMVTNNIRDLAPNQGVYSFLLNAQGRILGDMYVYNGGDHLMIDTERSQAPTIIATLQRYIIMDQVELKDISDSLTALAVQGRRAAEAMQAAGFQVTDVKPMTIAATPWNNFEVAVTRMASEEHLTYEIWAGAQAIGQVWDALLAAGATPVGTEALEMFRVAAGVPKFGQDIRERELPQETGQAHALSFTKGCYLGQEIVERIRSRGNVHRKLTGFMVDGPAPPPGTKLQANGKEVGELTSVASVPTADGRRVLALGYIRREAGTPGAVVQAGEAQARVEPLPFNENQAPAPQPVSE